MTIVQAFSPSLYTKSLFRKLYYCEVRENVCLEKHNFEAFPLNLQF